MIKSLKTLVEMDMRRTQHDEHRPEMPKAVWDVMKEGPDWPKITDESGSYYIAPWGELMWTNWSFTCRPGTK